MHAAELRGYLYRRAGEAGTELLGEVFVVAPKRLDDLPEEHLRRAWLYGTARRLLLAAERKTLRRHSAESASVMFVDDGGGAPSPASSLRSAAVHDALASLSEPDRELIRLTEWEQLPIVEAAAVLGLRSGTARVRMHRARRALAVHPALREFFASYDDPSSPPYPLAAT